LESDYNDIQGGTTGEGIHAGVMAGTIMIALTNFAGIDIRGSKLSVNPKLPQRWKNLSTGLHFKQTAWQIEIKNNDVSVKANKKAEVIIDSKTVKI